MFSISVLRDTPLCVWQTRAGQAAGFAWEGEESCYSGIDTGLTFIGYQETSRGARLTASQIERCSG